jgi:MFS family permease
MFATLRQRNFALLWSGGLISLAGDWVLLVGLPIYVLLLTHSVLATSAMMMAARIPNLLFGMVAGVLVDRWNRQRIMVVGDVLSALWLLPLLFVTEASRVWLVYIVAFVESSIEQFFVPAENALVPNLVSQEHLVAANSLSALSNNMARLVGPALGGVVAGFSGLPGIVLVDAASFALAGLLLAFIRKPAGQPVPAKTGQPAISWRAIWREWLDGLRLIRRERALGVLFSVQAITSLGEGVIGVLFIVFVSRVLHGGAAQVGWLMSAQAIGSLVGGVLIGWIGSRLVSRWWIGWCAVAFGLIDLVIFNSPAFFPVFLLTFALFVLVGLPAVAMLTGFNALQQMVTPDAYRGRVSSAFFTTGTLLGLLGTTIAGALGDHLGVVMVLNIQGGVYVLAGVLVMVLLSGLALEDAAKARVREEVVEPAGVQDEAG